MGTGVQDPPGAHEVLRKIAGFQTADAHTCGDTGMEKLTVANVQPHMGDKLAAFLRVVKKHQITGKQVVPGNRNTLGKLGIRGTGDGEATVVKDIFHQSGAVKASGLLPAVNIAVSKLGISPVQDPAAKLFQLQRF